MEIIRQGKPELQVIETMYKKECPRCYCQFSFNVNDTHFGDLIYDNCMYVRCPWCGHEIKEYF